MKTVIFLIFIILVVSAMIWKMRKSQAEEIVARRKAFEQKRKQHKEVVAREEVLIWPVIVKPAGKDGPGEDEEIEEPSMTTIEFKSPGKMAG